MASVLLFLKPERKMKTKRKQERWLVTELKRRD